MNTIFAIACVGAVAAAQGNSGKDKDKFEFMNYATKFGKSYKSVGEMEVRSGNYKKNKVEQVQQQLDNPRAVFGDS